MKVSESTFHPCEKSTWYLQTRHINSFSTHQRSFDHPPQFVDLTSRLVCPLGYDLHSQETHPRSYVFLITPELQGPLSNVCPPSSCVLLSCPATC